MMFLTFYKSMAWNRQLLLQKWFFWVSFKIYFGIFPCSWNDLIVGAPFYFDRMKDEGGAVYIFMNENGSFQKTASMVLKGPTESGFGFAVAAIGDINQDGFQGLTLSTRHVSYTITYRKETK